LDGSRCWLWTGSRIRKYGNLTAGGKMFLAHRFAYEALVEPIPVGRQIDHRHTCPKVCVNPAHLRAITQKQNCENQAGAFVTNKSSGIRGVTWGKRQKKWHVQVTHQGKNHHGGYFRDLGEAEAAAIELRNRLFTHNDADR
jgi:hypothetical protein